MAGGYRPGGRLSYLPLIRKHEDLIEQDFARMGWDYRDRYRRGGGESRMTVRRMLLLVDALDRFDSLFWAEVGGYERLSSDTLILTDIWRAVTDSDKPHPLRRQKELRAEVAERERKKQAIKAIARHRNARYKRARAAKQGG